ncbi:amidase [Novispirillum sp. DQ9]|uniref:amidase n=1 Tax=Novispirillum sp. DQ9 TaxID=3398612 RepID=UPI003C7D3191
MTDITDLSARALRALIGRRAVSPVEVAESALARVAAVNPALNAIVTLDPDRLRREARAAEAAVMAGRPLGPLHGIPVVVKDVHATGGMRTTWGSPLFADHVPARDDRLVATLRAAGALILGKTNTPEFAAGAHTVNPVFGLTRNPADPSRSCGGSSGGTAVALATGMAPLGTGTDLGGSLRLPASFCGVAGFRPSPGLVPSDRPEAAFGTLDVDGPMARTADDLALMLSVMSLGATPPEVPPADLVGLRIAVSPDLGRHPLAPSVRAAFAAAVGRLGPVVEAAPPLDDADTVFGVLRALAFVAAHGERLERHPDTVGPNVADNVRQGLALGVTDIAGAMAAHAALRKRFDAFMESFDVLLCPAAPVPPFPAEAPFVAEIDGHRLERYFHWLGIPYALTLTGCPVACIPAGTAEGLPFGIQVCGRRGRDAEVLGIARSLETLLA